VSDSEIYERLLDLQSKTHDTLRDITEHQAHTEAKVDAILENQRHMRERQYVIENALNGPNGFQHRLTKVEASKNSSTKKAVGWAAVIASPGVIALIDKLLS